MSLTGIPALIVIIIALGIPLWIAVMIISKFRRRYHEISIRWDNIVKTEYEAPLKLTPAELGYLSDSKFDSKELFATLLDLEQRGFLEIKKSRLGFIAHKTTLAPKELRSHEKFIYNSKSNGNNILNYLSGNNNTFKKLVREDLYLRGLVKKSHLEASLLVSRILVIYLLINIIGTSYIFIVSVTNGQYADAFAFLFFVPIMLAPIGIPISIVGGYIYNKVVGETSIWTSKMKSAWAEIEGYKEFIRQVELDNIQFESSELKIKTKNKTLPYAVALGFNTEWKERF